MLPSSYVCNDRQRLASQPISGRKCARLVSYLIAGCDIALLARGGGAPWSRHRVVVRRSLSQLVVVVFWRSMAFRWRWDRSDLRKHTKASTDNIQLLKLGRWRKLEIVCHSINKKCPTREDYPVATCCSECTCVRYQIGVTSSHFRSRAPFLGCQSITSHRGVQKQAAPFQVPQGGAPAASTCSSLSSRFRTRQGGVQGGEGAWPLRPTGPFLGGSAVKPGGIFQKQQHLARNGPRPRLGCQRLLHPLRDQRPSSGSGSARKATGPKRCPIPVLYGIYFMSL